LPWRSTFSSHQLLCSIELLLKASITHVSVVFYCLTDAVKNCQVGDGVSVVICYQLSALRKYIDVYIRVVVASSHFRRATDRIFQQIFLIVSHCSSIDNNGASFIVGEAMVR
jgi:hypothetical protein